MNFSETLLDWYDRNRRQLPWRDSGDPYRIWLSEIMLQQTRTETVERYYHRFLERFPTVFDLAFASEDEVLKLWEGLGYYSRARNLWSAAKTVALERNGSFPESAAALRALPALVPTQQTPSPPSPMASASPHWMAIRLRVPFARNPLGNRRCELPLTSSTSRWSTSRPPPGRLQSGSDGSGCVHMYAEESVLCRLSRLRVLSGLSRRRPSELSAQATPRAEAQKST